MPSSTPSAALLGALCAMTGCGGAGAWEGIWFVQMPVVDATACSTDIDENYVDAFAPDGGDPDSPWTFSDETTLSDQAFFIQVLEGDNDAVFLIVDDVVYPGTVTDDQNMTVSWSGMLDDHSSQEHASGYLFDTDEVAEVSETMTFVQGEDGNVTGQYSVASHTMFAWMESDRWKFDEVGVYDSQTPSASYLAGGNPYNMSDLEDCNGDHCELTITTDCSGDIAFTASYAGLREGGMYASIEDATRDAGASSTVTA